MVSTLEFFQIVNWVAFEGVSRRAERHALAAEIGVCSLLFASLFTNCHLRLGVFCLEGCVFSTSRDIAFNQGLY